MSNAATARRWIISKINEAKTQDEIAEIMRANRFAIEEAEGAEFSAILMAAQHKIEKLRVVK